MGTQFRKGRCIKLYQQEVAPAVLEIDELTKESSFVKNLGYTFLTDKSALEKTGKIFITIAMAGIISAFSDVLSRGQALSTAGGAYAISKVATAYKEYEKNPFDIMKKDMYFYFSTNAASSFTFASSFSPGRCGSGESGRLFNMPSGIFPFCSSVSSAVPYDPDCD